MKKIALVCFALAALAGCGTSNSKTQPQFTEEKINEMIDARIAHYVEAQRQAAINEKYKPYTNADETVESGKHIYGSQTARFTLVEYSDIECPYCKRFQPIPKEVVDSSKGLVNWEFVHFPLSFHNPVAFIEAQATECVASLKGNRAFWVFTDELFQKTRGNGQTLPDIATIAKSIGVDDGKFIECVKSGRFKDKIQASIDNGNKAGVSGTPTTFIVDNQTGTLVPMPPGEHTVDNIVQAISSVLSK